MRKFTAVQIVIAKTWLKLKCPSEGEQINQSCYSQWKKYDKEKEPPLRNSTSTKIKFMNMWSKGKLQRVSTV